MQFSRAPRPSAGPASSRQGLNVLLATPLTGHLHTGAPLMWHSGELSLVHPQVSLLHAIGHRPRHLCSRRGLQALWFPILVSDTQGIWGARQACLPSWRRPGPMRGCMLSLTDFCLLLRQQPPILYFLLLFAAFTFWRAVLLSCLVWTSTEARSNCLSVDGTGSQRGRLPWSKWLDLPTAAVIPQPFDFSFRFSLLSLFSVLMEYIQSCSCSLEG